MEESKKFILLKAILNYNGSNFEYHIPRQPSGLGLNEDIEVEMDAKLKCNSRS